ncbi:hypothetical protein [Phycicoccus avicenniae]|uniref:hypothetical protein n=1 Tax=Phycicoccus avicenniae TaxID=2828860 RepID=UPI003D29DAFC
MDLHPAPRRPRRPRRPGRTLHRSLGHLLALLVLAVGAALVAPAPAAATTARTTPTNPLTAVARQRPVVLHRVAAVHAALHRAGAAALAAGMPAEQTLRRTQQLALAQRHLTAAAGRVRSARTTTQLGLAATLVEELASEALPSAPEALARAQGVLDAVAALQPRLEILEERAQMGEYWGFDVSAWAVPERQASAEAAEATSLAGAVLAAVTASGTVTDRDAADLARAESLVAESTTLGTTAWDAWCGANAS